jgi:hypothetical protein
VLETIENCESVMSAADRRVTKVLAQMARLLKSHIHLKRGEIGLSAVPATFSGHIVIHISFRQH